MTSSKMPDTDSLGAVPNAGAESSPLGRASVYVDQYDASQLFPILRDDKRHELGWGGQAPFFGADLWTAFELSWLNAKGKPEVAMAHLVVPAESPRLIESKSLKLYFNSFNMTRFDSFEQVQDLMVRDLSQAAGARVSVKLLSVADWERERVESWGGVLLDRLDLSFDRYEVDAGVLTLDPLGEGFHEETLLSHLLKSNCLVTGQPDWASVQIRYVGRPIAHESVLRYLVGFRQHNEFHEQCVERIFSDIWRQCRPSELTVYARYTRRGGLDINPIRSSKPFKLPANLRLARQ